MRRRWRKAVRLQDVMQGHLWVVAQLGRLLVEQSSSQVKSWILERKGKGRWREVERGARKYSAGLTFYKAKFSRSDLRTTSQHIVAPRKSGRLQPAQLDHSHRSFSPEASIVIGHHPELSSLGAICRESVQQPRARVNGDRN